ncbi:Ig-like domain-containing protein [Vibrio parahaemolyticus]|uniref:Ig-like domain-containing protein n=1 Tax=Vibrio parahaemolyticus TaxID=670 RepID=UPI0015DF33D5|nr:Ig-like domain-containing protein [Vibrio parahaemolyticus]UJW92748.1 tandem-95 repeat protein [Vibrio parahaemolyticus]UJX06913.1 tandem-95 repeat protein [Vibrio parahaemolyticus]UJX07042.1 tandem-95 repeat protein [Vibrio parahaemolyticus]WCZ09826.1 tandem-95 repeat protein [Vibrio parahaemolyticus]WCZ14709.1 tandem-95 repeat protein [Vibrio parahaemolyticus]
MSKNEWTINKHHSMLLDDSRNTLSSSTSWKRIALPMLLMSTLAMAPKAIGAGGDFSNTDFTAAAPFTYNHQTGGGAYNDRTVGDYADVTEQLEGGQFTCGDIVTFLSQVQVEDNPVDALQSIELDFKFTGDSTGQSGAAISEIVNVAINYGQVENGDNSSGVNPGVGNFGLDSGVNDDGGSTAILLNQQLDGPLFTAGTSLTGTVQITDLEASESVVVRIDTRLACQAGTSPTGNLQGQLDAGRVISPTESTINTGQQTIPFLKVGDIAGAGEALLTLQKTVTSEFGVCGVDDNQELNAFTGETVKYCYMVTNSGTLDLFDVELTDDNGTPGNTQDDFVLSFGTLSGVSSITQEYLVEMPLSETMVLNTAMVTGNNGLSGGNYQQLESTDIARVYVSLSPNNPPVANDDNYETSEDTSILTQVALNDTDPDGNLDASSVTIIAQPSNGSLINNGDGSLTYTPTLNFTGQDTYQYQICDTSGSCDIATVTVNIIAVNDPPNVQGEEATIDQDTPFTVYLEENDSDPEGESITVTILDGPSNGQVIQNPDGSYTYQPNPGFVGTDTITYEVCDSNGACATGTLTITVLENNEVNSSPQAMDDSASTLEEQSVVINVISNDVDLEGNLNPASVTATSLPTNGTIINNGDGTFTYEPNENFNGIDEFTYQVCDTEPLCDEAMVTIEVLPVNDAPVAQNDSATTIEDNAVSIEVIANDIDVDSPLAISSFNQATNGTVTQLDDGTLSYQPNSNFNGTDSFSYEVCDPEGACDSAVVTVEVIAVNDPPVATDDAITLDEDTVVVVTVLENDNDVDNNLDASSVSIIDAPSLGVVEVLNDGSIVYTPAPNANGNDTFTYQVCDTEGACDTATVSVHIAPVNDAPIAVNDVYSTLEDEPLIVPTSGILTNDSDVDGDVLTATQLTIPTHGSLSLLGDGSFEYIPNPDFFGVDTFTYNLCDTDGLCDEATVTINVGAVNDAPIASDDNYTVDEDQVLNGDSVLINDVDNDGDTLTVALLTTVSNGELIFNSDGTFTYQPNENFNGTDSFTYQACDSLGECSSATVMITVSPVNDAPIANDDSYSTSQDTTLTIPANGVLINDVDIDNDPLIVIDADVTSTFGGVVNVSSDGSFIYQPADGFAGIDTFNYTVDDGNGGSSSATVTITVEAKNNRSISVELSDYTLSGNQLDGSIIITNMSDGYDVQIRTIAIEVQYRLPGQSWTYIDIIDNSCIFGPEPLFLVSDEQWVDFTSCALAQTIPQDATLRVVAKVQIYGRIKGKGKSDGWFISRLSK